MPSLDLTGDVEMRGVFQISQGGQQWGGSRCFLTRHPCGPKHHASGSYLQILAGSISWVTFMIPKFQVGFVWLQSLPALSLGQQQHPRLYSALSFLFPPFPFFPLPPLSLPLLSPSSYFQMVHIFEYGSFQKDGGTRAVDIPRSPHQP